LKIFNFEIYKFCKIINFSLIKYIVISFSIKHIFTIFNEITNEIKKIKNFGGNLIQCFVNIKYNKKDYDLIKKELINNNIKLVVHASYTINIAQDWNEHSWWLKQFLHEIELANYLGAFGIVIHLGKQLKLTNQEGINNMYTSMMYIYDKIKNWNINIFFETSAGQGSEMCYDLNEFAYFFNKFKKLDKDKDKFRICIDTCHIFQAGYDISNKKNIIKYFNNFEKLIGIRYIGLLHLNDSKNTLGLQLDRHENLGKGYIGKEALEVISKFCLKLNIPIVLETPDENLYDQEIYNYFVHINNS